jgi:hypothetical protein
VGLAGTARRAVRFPRGSVISSKREFTSATARRRTLWKCSAPGTDPCTRRSAR